MREDAPALREGGAPARRTDPTRTAQLAGRRHESYHGEAPVKPAPFKVPHIPLYFWLGGLAGGGWLVASAESLTGDDDRDVVRAGRFLALGGVVAGSGLLIADLGRPDRFLNMLRIVRLRSPMSLGSWALTEFGAFAGAGALLQLAEDGAFGEHPVVARVSRGTAARVLHALGLPHALFVASYTGTLLSATSTPSWGARARLLSPLYVASAVSSGLAGVQAALEIGGGATPGAARRIARAQTLALGAETALHLLDEREERRMPSADEASAPERTARLVTVAAGMIAPLVLNAIELRDRDDDVAPRRRRRSTRRLAAAGLALAGGLVLRYLTVRSGMRSAATPADTWQYASVDEGAGKEALPRQRRRTEVGRG